MTGFARSKAAPGIRASLDAARERFRQSAAPSSPVLTTLRLKLAMTLQRVSPRQQTASLTVAEKNGSNVGPRGRENLE
jgi:hypothetical protein